MIKVELNAKYKTQFSSKEEAFKYLTDLGFRMPYPSVNTYWTKRRSHMQAIYDDETVTVSILKNIKTNKERYLQVVAVPPPIEAPKSKPAEELTSKDINQYVSFIKERVRMSSYAKRKTAA
jgi:hypothetical protein